MMELTPGSAGAARTGPPVPGPWPSSGSSSAGSARAADGSPKPGVRAGAGAGARHRGRAPQRHRASSLTASLPRGNPRAEEEVPVIELERERRGRLYKGAERRRPATRCRPPSCADRPCLPLLPLLQKPLLPLTLL
ncbi:hypothetical protein AAFF_G00344900 [Aldrovandia affinis]|uniref:Uncharacterized protein n=1 Tax=Aldrovandia affinis TaxID=143900 RepID=A0AAD7R643_9TELE|nr:hypothetical protein AAFF_G00344900 [Aldrovandia affinis]